MHKVAERHPIRPPQFDVVLFGDKYLEWSPQLVCHPIWRAVPEIASVTHRGDDWRPRRGAPADARRLVLPLHESNIATAPRGSWALVPSLHSLRTFADKQRFATFVGEQGLTSFAPRLYEPGSETFPLVLKRTNLTGSDGVRLVRSRDELDRWLGEPLWSGRPVLLQEYVEGPADHVTHAVCVEGRIVWHSTYTYGTPAGALLRPRLTLPVPDRLDDADLQLLGRFIAAASFSGPVSIDYRRRSDGGIVVFEINPRFGGSLLRRRDRSDLRGALAAIVAHARWYG